MSTPSSRLAPALLIGSLAFAGCSAGNDVASSAPSATSSASATTVQEPTNQQKQQLELAVKEYLSQAQTSYSLLLNIPSDIQAILESMGDPETILGTVQGVEGLSEEDRQKLADYFREKDPTYDLFDRSALTESEDTSLSIVNVLLGSALSDLDRARIDDITIDISKVEFTDQTALLTAESFASADDSSTSAGPAPTVLFEGTVFKFEGDSWKIDAKSFMNTIDVSGSNKG